MERVRITAVQPNQIMAEHTRRREDGEDSSQEIPDKTEQLRPIFMAKLVKEYMEIHR